MPWGRLTKNAVLTVSGKHHSHDRSSPGPSPPRAFRMLRTTIATRNIPPTRIALVSP